MIEGGDAHSTLDGAVRVFECKALPPGFVVAHSERPRKQSVEDDGFAHHLFGRCGVPVVKEVSAPYLHRVDSHGAGDLLHVAFDGEDGLRRSEASKSAIWDGVCSPGA